MIAMIYDRRGNILCKINRNEMFAEIFCPECGGTGIWDYYPEDYIVTEKDLVCINCKGSGKMFVDLQ